MFRFFTAMILAATVFVITDLYAIEEGALKQGSSGGKASKTGATGSQFLKIGVGARAAGMAGAYGSIADDLTAIYWNPAGVADLDGMSANFSYTEWFGGFNHSFAAISFPMGPSYNLAFNAISLSSDDIPITTIMDDDGEGATYNVNDVAFGLTFSGYLTEEFSFGINAKYVSNSFSQTSANAIAFDIGTRYDVGVYGIKLGFSIHNLGVEMNYEGEELSTAKKLYDGLNASQLDAEYTSYPYQMPIVFRASISSEIIKQEEHNLIAVLDFNTLSDAGEQFALGAEYTWNGLLSFRGGYIFGKDQMGIAGGVGLNYMSGYFDGRFDYSINPTTDLGLIHRIGLDLQLN